MNIYNTIKCNNLSDFNELCMKTPLHELFNNYLSDETKSLLDMPILAGCDYYNNITNYNAKTKNELIDIDVRYLIGQVGKYSNCCGSCCSGHSFTWLHMLLNSDVKIRQLLHERIQKHGIDFILNDKPLTNTRGYILNFITPDNGKTFYTTNCSQTSIVVKGLIYLKNQILQTDDYNLNSISLLSRID